VIALMAALALGEEKHEATAPEPVAVTGVEAPEGPPRTLRVEAGHDAQAALRSLPAGSTLVFGPGVHTGPVVVDRPMVVAGEPGAVLDGAGRGTVLVVAAPDVTVRDLAIRGGGHLSQDDDSGVVVGADRVRLERLTVEDVYLGIDFRMASHGTVRDCRILGSAEAAFGRRGDAIRLWESNHNEVRGNIVRDTRDLVVWYSSGNHIVDNEVTGSRYATHLMHSDDNTVQGNRFHDNVVGVFVMYSSGIRLLGNEVVGSLGPAGVGLGFKESNAVEVVGNVLVRNTSGIFLDTTPHRLDGTATFRDNLIAANDVGLRLHGPQYGGEIVGNAFQANRSTAAVDGGVDSGKYTIRNNHWSDYAGYDLDGDGWGDIPYEARSLAGDVVSRHPSLRFFSGSAALALVDLFADAFPMFRPSPILVDAAPALRWERP